MPHTLNLCLCERDGEIGRDEERERCGEKERQREKRKEIEGATPQIKGNNSTIIMTAVTIQISEKGVFGAWIDISNAMWYSPCAFEIIPKRTGDPVPETVSAITSQSASEAAGRGAPRWVKRFGWGSSEATDQRVSPGKITACVTVASWDSVVWTGCLNTLWTELGTHTRRRTCDWNPWAEKPNFSLQRDDINEGAGREESSVES